MSGARGYGRVDLAGLKSIMCGECHRKEDSI